MVPAILRRRDGKAFYTWLQVLVVALFIGAVVVTVSFLASSDFLLTSRDGATSENVFTEESTIISSGNNVYVDHRGTTSILVDISGSSIPPGTSFNVQTQDFGATVSTDAIRHC
jgi:hypothetical protein